MKNQILYIDDNADNLTIFKEKFSETFEIVTSSDPTAVFNLLESQDFDAIILDVHMPEKDGFQVLKEITESRFSVIPVLLYTSDELQVIRFQAFSSAACDIIYRTLSDLEIELRILNKIQLFKKRNNEEKYLNIGALKLNLETLEAFHEESNLNLTPIEFKIIHLLAKSPNKVYTREYITNLLWPNVHVQNQNIDTHLSNLRKKLVPFSKYIKTIKSRGYILRIG